MATDQYYKPFWIFGRGIAGWADRIVPITIPNV